MKRKIIVVSLICVWGWMGYVPILWAQAQLNIPDIDTRVAELTKSLKLTEDQVPKVRSILESNRQESVKRFEKAREEGLLRERGQIMKIIQEGQKSLENQLATVLTKDQLKTYKKNEEIRRANARSRMDRGTGMGTDR
jgi:hypothetical protein